MMTKYGFYPNVPAGQVATILILTLGVNIVSAEVVFKENFDNQADWYSGLLSNDPSLGESDAAPTAQYHTTHIIPENWHVVYQTSRWSPSQGHLDRHESVEILESNASKARGGEGKSYVAWRDSYDAGWAMWNSDGMLQYILPGDGNSEIYAEYWITFSQEMIESYYNDNLGSGKMFRVIAHDDPHNFGGGNYFRYFGYDNKPIYIWGTGGHTGGGIRNYTSIYRYGTEPEINENLNNGPWGFRKGDWSGWYANSATDGQAIGGGHPKLTDYRDGGVITRGPVDIDQVFGSEEEYVKMGHYVKMNSAPGVPDGELMQFIDDKRISHITGIAWISADSPMKNWRIVAIGGNDNFRPYNNDQRYEEWYSIDDVKIRSSLPNYLIEGENNPMPPTNLTVESN